MPAVRPDFGFAHVADWLNVRLRLDEPRKWDLIEDDRAAAGFNLPHTVRHMPLCIPRAT